MIILDTNVISEVTKSDPSLEVLAWLNRQAEDTLHLTAVTIAEIGAGVHKLDAGKRRDDLNRRHKELAELFSGRTLSFDLGASMLFGQIFGDTRRKGFSISFADCMIASIASWRKCAVASRDVGPFEAAGVEVINPWNVDE